jgi:tetratricopeptide (TPR) repeat protein
MARWNSVSRWLNRFVEAGLLLLLAACQSGLRAERGPAPAPVTSAGLSAAEAPGAGPAPPSAAPGATIVPAMATRQSEGSAVYITAPAAVPDAAAKKYADALDMMKAGRVTDAEIEFKQLSATYPTLSGPDANLGLLYLQRSKLPEAETAFKTALERNPANAVAANELGIVERRLGKFQEAEAAYQRTIAADPSYAPAYLNLGVLYDLYLGEPQKALEQFEHYVQLAGENKQVAGWVAELRKRTGAASAAAKKGTS